MTLIFINETDRPVDESAVRSHLELILRRLKYADTLVIEVVFVGDKKIKQLNAKFRKINEPTDVLSFPAPATGNIGAAAGSVVLSLDTAAAWADRGGISLNEELGCLAGHGLLHLLGYNHA
jgi:probable rRNA maturation factor